MRYKQKGDEHAVICKTDELHVLFSLVEEGAQFLEDAEMLTEREREVKDKLAAFMPAKKGEEDVQSQ